MKKIVINLLLVLLVGSGVAAQSLGGYRITQYNVVINVTSDAVLDVKETITVDFSESRHGIFRLIPYKYPLQQLQKGQEEADRQLNSHGYANTILEDIDVDGWKYSVSTEGDYKQIKIGDKNKYVDGRQEYVITYKILNTINFFKDHSELYFNVLGDKWDAIIDHANFTVNFPKDFPDPSQFFVATGYRGERNNETTIQWIDKRTVTGQTTAALGAGKGLTISAVLPDKYLAKPNFMLRHIKWLIMPVVVFLLLLGVWWKWGRDESVTITTEFYPPKDVSPSVAGYIIDDKLDKRDLTALVPYWGGGGYLKIRETKGKDYEFIKLKDLPSSAMTFEQTLFNGIFNTGDHVMLSSLKDRLYTSMNSAKSQLESEVDKGAYYEKGSRGWGCVLGFIGLAFLAYGGWRLWKDWGITYWQGLAFIASGIIAFVFAAFMPKKSGKGNELYQKLAGFKEFIKLVEKPRLEQFLKEDKEYFDKVLPFAIVFDVADQWKDKLKDMDIPPPNWYAGNYNGFTTYMFLNSLDHSMNKMSESFYSAPSSSGTSGGSFSFGGGGGGGFSGGGFGGGGGGSW